MISIENVKKKYKFNTSELPEILKNFYTYTNTIDNPNYQPHLAEIHFNRLIDFFIELLEISAKECKIKSDYDLYYTDKKDIIPKVGFIEENFEFTVGLFRDFYIIWEIKNPDNIKNMKDEFWNLLFEFSKLGKFEYKENNVNLPYLRKKHPSLFNKRSNFFKLFRDFYLTQAEYKSTMQLGFLRLTWDNETQPDVLLSNLINSILLIYKLNTLLNLNK